MKYRIKPKPITIKYKKCACICNNCFNHNEVYIIRYNETDYETSKGNIGKLPQAKPRELWLCQKCFDELFERMKDEYNKI